MIPASSFVGLPSFLSASPTACSAPQAPAFFQIESYLPYHVESIPMDAGKAVGKAGDKAAKLETVSSDIPVDKELSV